MTEYLQGYVQTLNACLELPSLCCWREMFQIAHTA